LLSGKRIVKVDMETTPGIARMSFDPQCASPLRRGLENEVETMRHEPPALLISHGIALHRTGLELTDSTSPAATFAQHRATARSLNAHAMEQNKGRPARVA
jgi:hypothetical protein